MQDRWFTGKGQEKRHWSLLSVDIRVVIKDTRDRENIFNRNRKKNIGNCRILRELWIYLLIYFFTRMRYESMHLDMKSLENLKQFLKRDNVNC